MNKHIFCNILFVFLLLFVCSATVFAISASGEIKIFAVTEQEEGMAADLLLYTIPGSGQVAFVTSNSLVGKDTQTTGNIALQVAQQKTKITVKDKSFIFDIKANASEVDGPSAGAAMTLLMYSLLSEKVLSTNIGLTGTINSDGSVGVVGGVYPKAKVASEIGIKLFMIPKGEANQVIKEDGKVTSINLLSYGPEKLGMKVVEVTNIDEVINYAYSDIDSIEVDSTTAFTGFIPEAIKYSIILEPMEALSQNYIKRARSVVDEAKKELETTDLDEISRSEYYPMLGVSERNIEMAEVYLDQNYLYSAANSSFNARVVAGAVEEIAKTPSIISEESTILLSKISSLRLEINSFKRKIDFIPLDGFEWVIGAQQRIAYAENALNSLADSNSENLSKDELFDRVYDYVSAKAWLEAAEDFIAEAKKQTQKKIPAYNEDFIFSVEQKIKTVEKIIENSDVPDSIKTESTRRLLAAKISFDSNFFFAALYDAYSAEAGINSQKAVENLDINELEQIIVSKFNENDGLSSIWGTMYFDHAKFFYENSKYEESVGSNSGKEGSLQSSHYVLTLSELLEKARNEVNFQLNNTSLNDYASSEPIVDIKYVRRDNGSPLLVGVAIFLTAILVLLILLGIHSYRSAGMVRMNVRDVSRAEKLNLVLNRLDKALSKKKVNEAEYFFMKKKYEDEFKSIGETRSKRSKITLSLDESQAKLSALENGLVDLKKHYHAGLILPEDYEKNYLQVKHEIEDIKKGVSEYKKELKGAREDLREKRHELNEIISKKEPIRKFRKKKKPSEFDVKGTRGKSGLKVKGTG